MQGCLGDTHWGAQNINASASHPGLPHVCGLPLLLEGGKKKTPTTNHTCSQEFMGLQDLCVKVPVLLNLCYEYVLILILTSF